MGQFELTRYQVVTGAARANCSVIIRFLASKPLIPLAAWSSRLKRTVTGIAALILGAIAILSCGSSTPSTSSTHTLSGFAFRAFVTNALLPSGGATEPVIQIVDAEHDVLATSPISLLSIDPVMMVESPTLHYTMVFSATGNTIGIIDNQTEAVAANASGNVVPSILLPGSTESMLFSSDETHGYAAVPTAPIAGQPPGAVIAFSISTGQITATIPIPSAHYIAEPSGSNNILVFSDASDTVTVINTAALGTQNSPVSYVTGFDRPVGAVFSNPSSAYILNCGAECGGTAASVSTLKIGSSTAGTTIPVAGATTALLGQNVLYVAGSPPGKLCGSASSATTCGVLTLLNTNTNAIAGTATITDGYHTRMQMSQNGQLYIGSRTCSAGCLSIFNTVNSNVIFPTLTGDVTGMQEITGRNIVYLCEGGLFRIFDTTTDQILVQNTSFPLIIVGDATDVKLVD